jgi:hypothetical protein
VKNASHAINTLSPVRRVTAFFAFLGFLSIASCGEKEFDQTAIMEEQAEAFSEMAAIMDSVSDGSDPKAAAVKLQAAAERYRGLKRDLAALDNSKEEAVAAISSHDSFAVASKSYFDALSRLERSGKGTPEMMKALESIHDPAPMMGEGSSQ